MHSCQQCGMEYPEQYRNCPKCDYGRFEQNADQSFSVDIAHNMQTLLQAEQQFYDALAQAVRENYAQLRLVVGGGLINREAERWLQAELWKERITSFQHEQGNSGAYLVVINRHKGAGH